MRILNRVCANDVDVEPGRIVYTQWLNERGGIEADLTVTRLSETAYLIVGGAETESKDFNWLRRPHRRRRTPTPCSPMSLQPWASCPSWGRGPATFCNRSPPTTCRARPSPSAPAGRSSSGLPGCAPRASPTSANWVGRSTSPANSCRACMTSCRLGGCSSASFTRATTRSTPCVSKRRTGTGAMTSPTRTRRSRRVSDSRSSGTNRAASSAVTRCCARSHPGTPNGWCNSSSSTPRAPAVPQRTRLAGRFPGRTHSLGDVPGIPWGGAVGLGYVTAVGRRRGRASTATENRSRRRPPPWPRPSLRPLYDPKNERIK